MNNFPLTLCFSALGKNLDKLTGHIESLTIPQGVEVVIVVQKFSGDVDRYLSSKYEIHVIESVGLSKSRNKAISLVKSGYAWLLDDDVLLRESDLLDVLSIINQGTADFYRVKIGCIEWQDKTFKQYKKIDKVSRLNLLQVSSIEIIANINFIKQNQIMFNENIGLGTPYQGGEENHFLLDAWNAGAKFKFIDQVLVRHTCLFEERVLANDNIFRIRGATASRFGVVGILLLVRWLIRYSLKERKLSYIFSLLKGYIGGYRFFLN